MLIVRRFIKLQDLGNLFRWHWICVIVRRLTGDLVVVYFEYIQQNTELWVSMQVHDGGGDRSFEGTFSLTRIFCVHSCDGDDSRLNTPPRDLKRNFLSSVFTFFKTRLSSFFLCFFLSFFSSIVGNHGVSSYKQVGCDRSTRTCLTGPKKLELNFRSFYVSRLKSTYWAG